MSVRIASATIASAAAERRGSVWPSSGSGNAVADADQAEPLSAGAVGDVCHRFFDANGSPVRSKLDSRVVGIDPDTLRAIPRRVGLAGGHGKHRAIRAAVIGGLVNVLLTDLATARSMLK